MQARAIAIAHHLAGLAMYAGIHVYTYWLAEHLHLSCSCTGKDQENIENILKTMADLGTIHAVALVVSGTEGRAYTSMQSAFSQIKGHMPDSVAGNVMAIVTKCRPEER